MLVKKRIHYPTSLLYSVLWTSSIKTNSKWKTNSYFNESLLWDSNSRPHDYKSSALANWAKEASGREVSKLSIFHINRNFLSPGKGDGRRVINLSSFLINRNSLSPNANGRYSLTMRRYRFRNLLSLQEWMSERRVVRLLYSCLLK